LSAAWPGNIRELRNLITRWLRFTAHEVITPADLPAEIRSKGKSRINLRSLKRELEKEALIEALDQAEGSVTQAARALGVSRVTVYRKMKQHDIRL